MKTIGFTGHRNAIATEWQLFELKEKYGNLKWIYGGAKDGFDKQIKDFIDHYNIKSSVFKPNYKRYSKHYAPLQRNKLIVLNSSIIYAVYDGRDKGGTRYTINYAQDCGKEVVYLRYIDKFGIEHPPYIGDITISDDGTDLIKFME